MKVLKLFVPLGSIFYNVSPDIFQCSDLKDAVS